MSVSLLSRTEFAGSAVARNLRTVPRGTVALKDLVSVGTLTLAPTPHVKRAMLASPRRRYTPSASRYSRRRVNGPTEVVAAASHTTCTSIRT